MSDLDWVLKNASGAVLDGLAAEIAGEMKRIEREAVALMKETAPVSDRPRLVYRKKPLMGDDAKHLRDTIRSELKNNGLVITLKAGAGKFTAHFIELGTEHMEPHPFINPSLRIATGRIEEQLAAAAGRIRGLS